MYKKIIFSIFLLYFTSVNLLQAQINEDTLPSDTEELSSPNDKKIELLNFCHQRISGERIKKLNSFYRLKLNYTLPSIQQYLDEAPSNSDDRRNFNTIIRDLYSENFIAFSSAIQISEKRDKINEFNESSNCYIRRYRKCVYEDDKDLMFPTAKTLLNYLDKFNKNLLSRDLVPEEELKNSLRLFDDLDSSQISLFQDDYLDIFYEKELVLLDDFKLDRGHQRMFLHPETRGTLFFSIYVPFYDKNFKENSDNCIPCESDTYSEYMPKFYRKLTKHTS